MSDLPANGRAMLYRKLSEVTAAVGRIPKNGRNTFHNYSYATESDITDGLRALLLDHKLAFLPPSVIAWERDATTDNPKTGPRTRVLLQFEIACTESGEVYTAQLWGEGQDNGDKGFYKAYTGAVKYFLMKTFLIATGDDPEQDARPRQTAQPASYQPAKAGKMTDPQRKMLFATYKEGNYADTIEDWVEEAFGCRISELTLEQASQAIETLKTPAEEVTS